MPEASQIECPHCETKLKIKNPSLFGKKIRCPKCSEPFVAEAPPADEDEFAENLGSLGDDFGEPLPSAKLPAMPGRSKGPGQTGGTRQYAALDHLAVVRIRRRLDRLGDLGDRRL